MTIASDMGFVVGEEYRVVTLNDRMKEAGVKVGDYIELIRDDGDRLPYFRYKGERFCARIAGTYRDNVRVVPETRPAIPTPPTDIKVGDEVQTTCAGEFRHITGKVLCVPKGTRGVVRAIAEFDKAKSGYIATIENSNGYESLCLSILQKVEYSQTVEELKAENRSIERQIARMLKRIEKKRKFQEENYKEIERRSK